MSDAQSKDLGEENEQTILARKQRVEARAALPAVFIDTWAFLSWRGHVRISLGEEVGESDQYRFAFLMELDQAEQFAHHVLRIVARRRENEAAPHVSKPAATGDET